MAFQIMVQFKGGKTDVYSPQYGSREEAEAELAKIKGGLVYDEPLEVSWMAAAGTSVLGAHVIETQARGGTATFL